MSDAKIIVPKGWGWPNASRKAHYFINRISLCNKWIFGGELDNTNTTPGPDDCVVCARKVANTTNGGRSK
jgi:hypothetical protein